MAGRFATTSFVSPATIGGSVGRRLETGGAKPVERSTQWVLPPETQPVELCTSCSACHVLPSRRMNELHFRLWDFMSSTIRRCWLALVDWCVLAGRLAIASPVVRALAPATLCHAGAWAHHSPARGAVTRDCRAQRCPPRRPLGCVSFLLGLALRIEAWHFRATAVAPYARQKPRGDAAPMSGQHGLFIPANPLAGRHPRPRRQAIAQ